MVEGCEGSLGEHKAGVYTQPVYRDGGRGEREGERGGERDKGERERDRERESEGRKERKRGEKVFGGWCWNPI